MSSTPSMQRISWGYRPLLRAAIVLMVTAASCFILLEAFMIVLEPYLFTGLYQYDPELGFRVRPNARGTNSFGFNDHDYPLVRRPGSFRMLIVGDSLGWTGGLEGNYTAILERKLEHRYGNGYVEVINTGYPMTATAEQLGILRRYGFRYDPDLVVLGFFVGNDFLDADPYRKRLVLNNTYFDIDRRHELRLFGYPMVPQSRLIKFLKQRYTIWKKTRGLPGTQEDDSGHATERGRGTFLEEAFLDIEKARLEFCRVERHSEKEFQGRVEYALESILRMRDILRSRGIRFVVGIYPDEFQINETLLDDIFDHYALDRGQYDIDLMQKLLTEHLRRERIAYVDLLPVFRDRGKTTRLYQFRDTHWNEQGNELAAETLFHYLVSEGLVRVR